MTKLKSASAEPSVEEATALVAKASQELATLRARIVSWKDSLPDLAKSDNDEKYETRVLEIERAERGVPRAETRLAQAREALAAAKSLVEQERRQSLYDAAQGACREAEKLIKTEYKKHAAALATVLARLNTLSDVVKVANENLPEGMTWLSDRLDLDAFRHQPATPPSTRTETEFYHVDADGHECEPQYSWDPTTGKNVLRSKIRERKKTVNIHGGAGVKVSPLTSTVKLPAAAYGEDEFWPKPEAPTKYHEPTVTTIDSLQKAPPPSPRFGESRSDGARLYRMPACSLVG